MVKMEDITYVSCQPMCLSDGLGEWHKALSSIPQYPVWECMQVILAFRRQFKVTSLTQ